jgi:hemolysin activation/secretion protein
MQIQGWIMVLLSGLGMSSRLHAAEAAPVSGQQFDVLEYRVLGNTQLPAEDIERAVYPFLGPQQDLASVEQARSGLEQAYRQHGYGTVYVDIPEQSVDSGVVRLRVTEGRLRKVAVEGARYFSGRQIRAALPSATVGAAPALPELQAELAAVNARTPDRQVTPVLAAGTLPGTVDLKLVVKDTLPLHGSVEVNDRYTADTTRLRATLALSYDNMFNRQDSLGVQYQTAPQETSEMGVLAANYTARLNSRGDSLSLLYVNSDSNVAALGTLAVLGTGQIYSLRYQRPLVNSFDSVQSVSFGVEYKDFSEVIRLEDDEDFATPISYLNFSLSHFGTWRTSGAQYSLSSSVNFGPRAGTNSDLEFANKRYRARPNYLYLRSDAAARIRLPLSSALRLRLGGQYAPSPVIANEQFAIGGFDGVRGYLEAEELGDRAVRTSIELAPPPLRLAAGRVTVEAFGFFDWARVWTVSPLPDEPAWSTLRSWGAGLALNAFDHVSGTLMWALPRANSGHTAAGESRLHFNIRSSW